MNGYNGDAISESEWDAADRESLERGMEEAEAERNRDHGECIICGEPKDENDFCSNGCDIGD
jgi:hypothetical protein